jgi:hypothetical protein
MKQTSTEGSAMISPVEQPVHVKLSGDIEGAYVVTEKRPGGELVIAPDTSWKAMLERSGHRDVTAEELAEFEAEHGPFLPPDGEG